LLNFGSLGVKKNILKNYGDDGELDGQFNKYNQKTLK